MLQGEHSAILSTFIKLPVVIKTFILFIFEWPIYTGLTEITFLCSKNSLNWTRKYLSISGVPVSTQWEPNGHHYPIQIAQFALSHYSKYLRDGEPDRLVLMTGKEDDIEDWSQDGKTFLRSMWDKSRLSEVLEFRSSSGNIAEIMEF